MSQHMLWQKGAKLDKTKLKKEKVFLGPEHGAGVYVNVRGLTAPESEANVALIQRLSDAKATEDERKGAAYGLIACCVVDDDGVAVFDGIKDVEDNFDVAAADFVKILDVINRLSGFDKDRSKN